jgi:hypothetical protein
MTNYKYYTGTSIKATTGLVAAYNMIPSAGGVLVDISGNGNNGVINGALSTKDGMKFDGVKDTVITTQKISGGTPIKIKTRFKIGATNPASKALFSCGGWSGSIKGLLVTIESSGALKFWASDGSIALATLSSSIIITPNSTNNICLYWNGVAASQILIYNNGQFIESLTAPNKAWTGDSAFVELGSYAVGTVFTNNIEYEDFKLYNSSLTTQQAKDYHNSFNKITFRDNLLLEGADGIVKTPKDYIKGTGSYKVEEYVIEEGEQIDTILLTAGWANPGDGIYTHTANASTSYLYQSSGLTLNKTYKFTYEILENPNSDVFSITAASFYSRAPSATVGVHTINNIALTTAPVYIAVNSSQSGGIKIGNISVVEIPPLPNFNSGTKYLQCTVAGTLAIQSKQAYGVWEFDMYKGADGNNVYFTFIDDRVTMAYETFQGYYIQIDTNETIILRRMSVGSASYLTVAAPSYIAINTWYRLKVERLQSEGVFLDIPTLQVSDLINYGDTPYNEFTAHGKYGFEAAEISLGYGTPLATTADEIPIVNTMKYLVEFDTLLYSGELPTTEFQNSPTDSPESNSVVANEGRNSIILTATATTTGVLIFRNTANTLTHYKISGLTIRRIYPANTFLTSISGGAFGETYVPVSTVGGSGTNPVTDGTYTTSEFTVYDLDAGDRAARISQESQVKQ